MIQADVQWKERYVSHALNRKFTGVVDPGVYQGFECEAVGGDILVGSQAAPSVAVAEVNGYSITVRMDAPETVTPSVSEPYVVLDAYYAIGIATRASLKAVAEPADHQLVLCKAEPSGSTWMLDLSERSWGRTPQVDGSLADLAASDQRLMARQIALLERVKLIEDALYSEKDGEHLLGRLVMAEQNMESAKSRIDALETELAALRDGEA